MASAVREPITGVWDGAQRGPGAEPLVRGSGGRSPPPLAEAETLLAFGRSLEAANLSTFLEFGKAKNHRYLCCLCKNEV